LAPKLLTLTQISSRSNGLQAPLPKVS